MKLKLTAALLSTALLCACMGSSPEKQLPPAAVITPTPTPTVSEVSSMSTAEANKMTARNAIKTNTSSTFDITIMTPIMSGGELVYDNGVTPSVKTAVLTIDLTDPDTTVTEDNKFFITQRTDALQGNTVRGTDTFDLTMSDTVWSGGIKTGLKYSEFGYWETHFNMEVASAVDGNRYYKNDDYIPFYMYDASKKKYYF